MHTNVAVIQLIDLERMKGATSAGDETYDKVKVWVDGRLKSQRRKSQTMLRIK